MANNKTQVANNIGVSTWFSRLLTAGQSDAVIKATWIQPAVC